MIMQSELPKIQKFVISTKMASEKNIPYTFEAVITRETAKAVFVEGHGLMPMNGTCAKCGRKLTHPGSKILGIGPECLGSWSAREVVLDNLTPEMIQAIKDEVEAVQIKTWLPKSMIKNFDQIDVAIKIVEKKIEEDFGDQVVIIPDKKRNATAVNNKIAITFDFDSNTVVNVKTLSKRSYEAETKTWYAAITFDNIKKLREFGFTLSDELKEILKSEFKVKPTNMVPITGLNGTLMPFQEEGVNFLLARKGRGMINDEMGLGKTVQALGYLHMCKDRPAIIVVPASLKGNWKNEAEKWLPGVKVRVISGGKIYKLDDNEDIIIINYDILKKWNKELLKINPKIMILDESHSIKNNSAIRTKVTLSMAKKIPSVIALSGTPAINRPAELYNAIKIIEPKMFSSFSEFGLRYCNGHFNGYGWDYSGASNLEELYEKLQTIMIRRKKADVLTDLPDKIYSFVPMELTNEKEYFDAENDFLGYIEDKKGKQAAIKASYAETLVRIASLRQLAVKGALKSSIEWIDNFLDSSDQKIVIFAIHKDVIDMVMEHYGDIAVKIDGSVPVSKRQDIVERFQNDSSVRVFVGNIKAAGVGLTLTASSSVAFLELPWTPGELQQAEDRCHRIGQKDAVNIYYLLAEGTIEEELAQMIDNKKKVLAKVLDGIEDLNEDDMVSELIARLRKK